MIELAKFFEYIKKDTRDITADDVRIYLAYCKKTCNDVTADNKRRYINSYFEWCFNEEIIPRNPVIKVDKIKSIKKVKEAFTDMEIEKMRAYLTSNQRKFNINGKDIGNIIKLRNIAIFEMLLSTGVRCAELISIDRKQVENGQNEIIILGKGKKERVVYLNAKTIISIQNYLKARKDDNPALFISYFSEGISKKEGLVGRLTIAGVEIFIRKTGKQCNIEAYPHKFRRTSATMLVSKGMPIEQVQKMLGHATLNTTQIYVNVSENDVKNSHSKYMN